jgi:hypothetical protein
MHWTRKGLWGLPLVGLALIGYIASNYDLCSASTLKDAPSGCVEFWLNRYQTLLTAFIAFVAAWVAVKPVWKQLRLSEIQASVSLRESISSRVNLLATRAEKSRTRLKAFYIQFATAYESTKDDASKLSHWIWDQENIINDQIAYLENEQSENIDGDGTTISRQKLLISLRQLENCVYEVNATVHLDYNVDEVEEAQQAAAEQEELKAKENLPNYIATVENALVDLEARFDRDIEELRLKRQLLDQILAASEVN